MVWMRKSKACQMKRIRREEGVEAERTRREMRCEVRRMRTTARSDTIVVVSMWSIMEPDMVVEASIDLADVD